MARLFVDKYIRHFQFAEERGRERSTWRTHGKLLRANWGNGEVGIFSVGCYVLQLQIGGRGTTKGNGRSFSPTWTSIATLWFPPNRGGYKRQPMQLFVVSLHLEAMAANKLPKMTWLWKSLDNARRCGFSRVFLPGNIKKYLFAGPFVPLLNIVMCEVARPGHIIISSELTNEKCTWEKMTIVFISERG